MLKKLLQLVVLVGALMGMFCFTSHVIVDAIVKKEEQKEAEHKARCEEWAKTNSAGILLEKYCGK